VKNYDLFIHSGAVNYGVDQLVIRSIITQESKGDPYAFRYEPNWNYLVKPLYYAGLLKITETTEVQAQKMSWGLGQIMGSVARECGHYGPMGQLFDPEINIRLVCVLVKKLMKQAKTIDAIFASYNGGPGALLNSANLKVFRNQAYVDQCLHYYRGYKDAESDAESDAGAGKEG
jgi:soluble lytic murein transglycosylase-like protein